MEEAAERWERDEGPGATAGDANRAGAGDCGAVAGKVTVRRAIIILCGHEPANRTGGRESYWHSGELKDVGERRGGRDLRAMRDCGNAGEDLLGSSQ